MAWSHDNYGFAEKQAIFKIYFILRLFLSVENEHCFSNVNAPSKSALTPLSASHTITPMRFRSLLASLVAAICLAIILPRGLLASDPPATPPHPRILEASQAPKTVRLLRHMTLTYAPHMTERAREIDYFQKVQQIKPLLGMWRPVELRYQTQALLAPKQPISWEEIRRLRWPGGEPVGVTLEVPVWVPARAQRLTT